MATKRPPPTLRLALARDALKAIAEMQFDSDTDHAQLSALCVAIAKHALNTSR